MGSHCALITVKLAIEYTRMKYLLIVLSLTAVLADPEHADFPDPFSFMGEETSVDSFLEQSVDTELPCTIKPCFPVCKQKTLYMSFGLFKIPYRKNVCTPATSCINANKACQALLIKTIQRAQAEEKKVKASYSAAKMAHANSATRAKAAKAAKAEAAAAAKAMDAAKKWASAKTAQYGAAVKEFNQANALKNAKKKTMDAAVAQYERAKKSHLKAVAAMHSANSAAAKALADFRAKAKAHCDSEALHAQLVRSLGHAKLATKNCQKFGGSGMRLGYSGSLVKGKVVKTGLTLPKAYTITFDITLRGRVGNWGSVFHFTKGGNCCGYGSRVPAMWFTPNSNKFIIVDGTKKSGNANNVQGTLSYNKKYSVKMVASANSFDTYLNGKHTGSLSRHGVAREAISGL